MTLISSSFDDAYVRISGSRSEKSINEFRSNSLKILTLPRHSIIILRRNFQLNDRVPPHFCLFEIPSTSYDECRGPSHGQANGMDEPD